MFLFDYRNNFLTMFVKDSFFLSMNQGKVYYYQRFQIFVQQALFYMAIQTNETSGSSFQIKKKTAIRSSSFLFITRLPGEVPLFKTQSVR